MLTCSVRRRGCQVADDNVVNRKVAEATMLKFGAEAVESCSSGAQALQLLLPTHNFDCVLLDLHLPDIDG